MYGEARMQLYVRRKAVLNRNTAAASGAHRGLRGCPEGKRHGPRARVLLYFKFQFHWHVICLSIY